VRKKLIGESMVLCLETALQCISEQTFKRSCRDEFNLPHAKELQYLSEQIFISLETRTRNMWNFLCDLNCVAPFRLKYCGVASDELHFNVHVAWWYRFLWVVQR
jgi:hypothetical protein